MQRRRITLPAALGLASVVLTTGLSTRLRAAETDEAVNGRIGIKIDQYLGRLAAFGYSGAAIVAKDGKVILRKGYGLADREKGSPVSPDTVFTIGSITKQFTGAAIVKLEMEGKLSVDDPIRKYFTNVPLDKADITIHHLLTHTAGMPDALGGDHDLRATRAWFLDQAMQSKLLSTPGQRHRYSNVGYSLLGMIVEKASGLSYEKYLQEHLFEPAGMTKTGYLLPGFKPEQLAVGYRDQERWGTVLERPMIEDGPCWNLKANGGIHSTIDDMYKWHVALEGDDILSASAKKKYFAPHVSEGGGGSFYGYGWVNFKTPRGTRLLAHNGGNMIFSADIHRYVDEGVVVFVTSSVSEFFIDPISSAIARIVFDEPFRLPPKRATLGAATLARYAGIYELPRGDTVAVSAKAGGLQFAPQGQEALSAVAPGGRSNPRRCKQLNERTANLIERSVAGDVAPLHKAFGGRLPLAGLAEGERKDWQERQDKLGRFKAVKVLGSAAFRGGMTATVVCLDFERGSQFVKYVWEGSSLAGVRSMSAAPAYLYHPLSETDFIAFSLRARNHPTIAFQTGPDGSPTSLIVKKPSRDVVATRRH